MQSNRFSWRVIDIVTAAVLAVATGLVFLLWNVVGGSLWSYFDAVAGGLGGLASGVWFIGGVLGALIIRKPGAALFVELLAASVSAVLGSQWGISTLYSGIAQGLGAGLVFALFAYRKFTLPVAILAGAGAGFGAWLLELFVGKTPNIAYGLTYNLVYLAANLISGALLAGLLGWYLTRALAATGVLSRFDAGRSARFVD